MTRRACGDALDYCQNLVHHGAGVVVVSVSLVLLSRRVRKRPVVTPYTPKCWECWGWRELPTRDTVEVV